jgi:hypothetical protein
MFIIKLSTTDKVPKSVPSQLLEALLSFLDCPRVFPLLGRATPLSRQNLELKLMRFEFTRYREGKLLMSWHSYGIC